jgi:hypothetical protein
LNEKGCFPQSDHHRIRQQSANFMPSVKTAPKPKQDAPMNACIVLAIQNMDAMAGWCRRSRHPGNEVGHIVMQEIALANLVHAWTLAIEGKRWQPPQE